MFRLSSALAASVGVGEPGADVGAESTPTVVVGDAQSAAGGGGGRRRDVLGQISGLDSRLMDCTSEGENSRVCASTKLGK